MSKLRKITRLNADPFASIDGIGGDLLLNHGSRPETCSMVSTDLDHQKRSVQMANAVSRKPYWCQVAFMFEKERRRAEPTDWSFVLPVWIAITLFCSLVQIVAFKSIYSVFV
ncbi:MAG: hypothetical protein AAFR82_05810 [Pseudomonadota bacterium]